MTVDELDKAYGEAPGYPISENKSEKVAFADGLLAAASAPPAESTDPASVDLGDESDPASALVAAKVRIAQLTDRLENSERNRDTAAAQALVSANEANEVRNELSVANGKLTAARTALA
jgi:hypothetical protein